MKKTTKLMLCLVLLVSAVATSAHADFLLGFETTVPGANCLVHCASSCWCQVVADTPADCATAATVCCQNTGCNGVGNFSYSSTASSTSPSGGI